MHVDADQGCVLAVDDQVSELLIIEEALGSYYKIVTTSSPTEAIKLAKLHRPDVILLDIEMPGMDGFELCKTLQAIPDLASSSFIFITSHHSVEMESRALRLGASDFIPKPIHVEVCRLRVKSQMIIKQQAFALSKSFKDLHREKKYLHTILRSIGDAVITTDKNGIVSFLNPIAERLTGWQEKQAAGTPIDVVMDLREASTNTTMANPIYFALEQQRTVAMAMNAKLVSQNGTEYRVEDSASPIFDPLTNTLLGGVMVFRDVTEAIAMSTQMTHITHHDHLTGLPNRVLLHDRMLQAIQARGNSDRLIAVLLIDLDNFKYLNDSLGHQTGDAIIVHLASRLEDIAQNNATVSRIGGDEFVFLMPTCKQLAQINQMAQQLIHEINQPFSVGDEEHRLTVSMGISVYPVDASSPEELISHADTAMYKVKHANKNGFAYYSDELYEGMKERVVNEKLLHKRLKEKSLLVYFQPKYRLADNTVSGMEALVRIKDDDDNIISPLSFIPVAEETGLIIELGNQVLDQSCALARQLLTEGNPIKIAVNVSASQFNDTRFTAIVADILLKHELPAKYLELEITESALIENINSANKTMRQLRKIGVSIALDDFGTGYSSLSYLRNFNFNVLKIDRSFVKDLDKDEQAQNIVMAIVTLARSLDLQIVCEGIETEHQLTFLKRIGCHEGQGFYFTQPLPYEQLKSRLYLPNDDA
ncbi:two-component system response regulator [Alteromonas lipolytica]|uniref:Two-component system response regulator n=1 Tax=Alteromonas lipolytica TaxID=1856405 RepID=A0A1E8FG48_9ALTE|nr:EAL domain-containing protein [Alteromonas lipolytica]OFI34894.1 hypothetical protein BFC17_15100 [Alteromonas lipolytica]GGF54899.1 two-component system response regulator [Alteromonas lipolytica]